MYCKSAICKSGQFEFDSVINWTPVKLFEVPLVQHVQGNFARAAI